MFQNCGTRFEVGAPELATNPSQQANSSPQDSTNPAKEPPANEPTEKPGPSSDQAAYSIPQSFSAGSLQVCKQGCPYKLPSEAVNASIDGSIIEIEGGIYEDCIELRRNNLTVRGIKTRAHLYKKICAQKGIVVNYGKDNALESLELSGHELSDYTGAGVRQDARAINLTLTNVHIHTGQFGILGSSQGDTIRIEHSLFENLGILRPDGEISVSAFIGSSKLLYIRNSKFLSPRQTATEIKTRSLETIIDCSTVATLDGSDSYGLDFQFGGKVSITNSTLQKGAKSVNNTMIAYGLVGWRATEVNEIILNGNTLISDRSNAQGVKLNTTRLPTLLQLKNNSVIGISTNNWINLPGYQIENQFFSSREQLWPQATPTIPPPGPCSPPPL